MENQQNIHKNRRGRPKGSRDKITAPLRSMIGLFLQKNWKEVEKAFKKLEPREKVQAYERLLKYYLPQLQSISHINELEAQIKNLDGSQLEELMNKILDAYNLQNNTNG